MEERLMIIIINIFVFLLILVLQILIPYISKRNIILGVKLPALALENKDVKGIIKKYIISNIFVGLISIAVISYFLYYFYSDLFMTLSSLIFLGILFLNYLFWNRRMGRLKKEMEWDKHAQNIVLVDTKFSKEKEGLNDLSKWWIILPLLIIVFNLILIAIKYPSLGDKIPSHWDMKGNVDGYMKKSILSVLMMPATQLGMAGIMYLAYYAMKKSKQDIDPENPDLSLRKNIIFRRSWAIFFLISTLGLELLFTLINMAILGIFNKMKVFNIITLLFVIFMGGGSLVLALILGQGGDRIKSSSQEGSIGYGREDDSLWKIGNSIYYNPDDPAIFVEKRVGVGWTVNGGRPLGMIILILPFLIIIGTIFMIK